MNLAVGLIHDKGLCSSLAKQKTKFLKSIPPQIISVSHTNEKIFVSLF